MRFNHKIVWIHGNCEETEIARRWFRNSFTKSAYNWFGTIARGYTSEELRAIAPWVSPGSTNAYLPDRIQIFSVKSDPQIIDLSVSISAKEVDRIFRRGLMAEIMQEFTDNNDELLHKLAR